MENIYDVMQISDEGVKIHSVFKEKAIKRKFIEYLPFNAESKKWFSMVLFKRTWAQTEASGRLIFHF